jgi:hypothetical protein
MCEANRSHSGPITKLTQYHEKNHMRHKMGIKETRKDGFSSHKAAGTAQPRRPRHHFASLSRAAQRFSFARNCFRAFATFGATTAWQYG